MMNTPRATGRLIPLRRRFVAVDDVGDIQILALGLILFVTFKSFRRRTGDLRSVV